MHLRKAVIPVAGLGTRFLPVTKAIPKEMLPVVDRPTIQYVVEEAAKAGLTEIMLVTSKGKQVIVDHFDLATDLERYLIHHGKPGKAKEIHDLARLAQIMEVRQLEPMGLGGAVYCARHFVGDEPFAVLLGDDILVQKEGTPIGDLVQAYNKVGGGVLSLMEVPKEETDKYGIATGRRGSYGMVELERLVEKPPLGTTSSQLAIMGRYILPPEIFGALERTAPDADGEVQLTDAISILMKEKTLYGKVFHGDRYDVGDKVGFIVANLAFALQRPELAARLRRDVEELLKKGQRT